MRRIIISSMIGLAMFMQVGTVAFANGMSCPTPGGGPAFGKHIAEMAPEHPVMNGRHFGKCVSGMARGIPCPDCPHHH